MPQINLIQKRKSQKNMIFVLLAVVIITVIVVYNGFLKGDSSEEVVRDKEIFIPKPEVKINFDVLENSVLKELQPFSEIQSLELATGTDIGRENPFSM